MTPELTLADVGTSQWRLETYDGPHGWTLQHYKNDGWHDWMTFGHDEKSELHARRMWEVAVIAEHEAVQAERERCAGVAEGDSWESVKALPVSTPFPFNRARVPASQVRQMFRAHNKHHWMPRIGPGPKSGSLVIAQADDIARLPLFLDGLNKPLKRGSSAFKVFRQVIYLGLFQQCRSFCELFGGVADAGLLLAEIGVGPVHGRIKSRSASPPAVRARARPVR